FGVPRVENIERVLSRRLGILLMCAVSIAPVADAREQKEDDTEPEKPTPAEIPVVPVSMTHGDSPQTGPGCGRRLDGTMPYSGAVVCTLPHSRPNQRLPGRARKRCVPWAPDTFAARAAPRL